MLQNAHWHDLVHLTEAKAVEQHFDALNARFWRLGRGASIVAAMVAFLALASEDRWLTAAMWGTLLIAVLVLLVVRNHERFVRHTRVLLLAHLVAQMMVVVLSFRQATPAFVFASFVFPAAVLFLRLRGVQYLTLAGVFLATAVWLILRNVDTDAGTRIGQLAGAATWIVTMTLVSQGLTRRVRNTFVASWQQLASRAKEHNRMRGELDDARVVQLAMLPENTPELAWLEVSTVSLPASEVGGDYYDFIPLSGNRLAVVIADVAGHGMASALVLASLRSGIHLLRDEFDQPIRVLDRLNSMLRETIRGRQFVTLQLVVLDWDRREVAVTNAGHPPCLLRGAASNTRALGRPAPPLGTGLAARFAEERAPLAPGDALVLFTDGVPEVRNHHGDQLGEDRLATDVSRLAADLPARGIRDDLLSRISSFKGDVEQEDDLTLVVLKVREVETLRG